MTNKIDLNIISDFYNNRFDKSGPNLKSVGWNKKTDQELRFYHLLRGIDFEDKTILDFGCGLGHLYEYMKKNKFSGNYCGVDILEDFIFHGRQMYSEDKQANFMLIDGTKKLPSTYDFVVASGVFNNKRHNNEEFMLETICAMFKACRVGIALNAISAYVDYEENKLFFYSPEKLLSFSKNNLGGHPIINHNYKLKDQGYPHDFTLTVFKEPQIPDFNI